MGAASIRAAGLVAVLPLRTSLERPPLIKGRAKEAVVASIRAKEEGAKGALQTSSGRSPPEEAQMTTMTKRIGIPIAMQLLWA